MAVSKSQRLCELLIFVGVLTVGIRATAQDDATPPTSPVDDTEETFQAGNRILILAPSASPAIDENRVTELASIVAVETAAVGPFEIVSTRYVTKMLNVESTENELGCATETCLGEIADALDADFVVHSQLEIVNAMNVLRLSLFDARKHMNRGSVLVQVDTWNMFPDAIAQEYPKLFTEVLAERSFTGPEVLTADTTSSEAIPPALPTIQELPRETRKNDQSAIALVSVGSLIGSAGIGAVVVGLWPFAEYMMAREQAFQAIGARSNEDYQTAVDASLNARISDEVWGRVTWIAGGVAIGVGSMLLSAGLMNDNGEAIP